METYHTGKICQKVYEPDPLTIVFSCYSKLENTPARFVRTPRLGLRPRSPTQFMGRTPSANSPTPFLAFGLRLIFTYLFFPIQAPNWHPVLRERGKQSKRRLLLQIRISLN